MKITVRLILLLAGLLWLFFFPYVLLEPPELCDSLPGYRSPDELSLFQYRHFAGLICMAPLFITLWYPRQMKTGRVMLLFGAVLLATGVFALCCLGLMQYVYLTHHCGGITVTDISDVFLIPAS
uniref:Putative membrane protein n=1 Tax=Erwinia amylovora TaxID=552 RepID=A0A0P0ZHR2_ERWAM|nr:hypothetical protein [Erwinia amylovora]CDM08111.1 putative membrane protein [Erwinia amylovora]